MNCIKCGRQIPDGELFCSICSQAPGQREPARRPAPAPVSRSTDTRKPANAAPVRPQERQASRKGLAVSLVLVCLLLAASVGYIFMSHGRLIVEENRLQERKQQLEQQENEMAALQQSNETLSAQLENANSSIAILEDEIAKLEQQLNQSESNVSQSQYDLTSQKQQLEKLTEEKAALEAEAQSLQSQLDSLQSSYTAASTKANFMDSYVVFVNNDGTNLYHTFDCSRFKRDNFWAYSRKLAESNGYDPCPQCH